MKSYIAFLLFLLSLSYSCSKSDTGIGNPVIDNGKKFSENIIPHSPYKLTVYLPTDSIVVGYNPLQVTITDTITGNKIKDATIVIVPVMTANKGAHIHSGPVEQPVFSDSLDAYIAAFIPIHGSASSYDPVDGSYTGWRLKYVVTVNGNTYDTLQYDIATKTPKTGTQFLTSVAGNDGNTYYLALVHPQPSVQTVGIQDVEIGIFLGQNHSMDFATVTDLGITHFYPYMPDMGHSSPNNTTPVSIGKGHYRGKVNFTMGGTWDLIFTGINQGSSSLIDSTALQVAF